MCSHIDRAEKDYDSEYSHTYSHICSHTYSYTVCITTYSECSYLLYICINNVLSFLICIGMVVKEGF